MKTTFLLFSFMGVAMARRSSPATAPTSVHRMGWGLDDDVYFAEPQIIPEQDVTEVKSVKRTVRKPDETTGNTLLWGVTKLSDLDGLLDE